MSIRWSKPALDDLTNICDYTKDRFGAVQARRTALLIYDAATSLQEMPDLGRIGRKTGTRELVISSLPFVPIYRTRQETIEILRILHGAQQWP